MNRKAGGLGSDLVPNFIHKSRGEDGKSGGQGATSDRNDVSNVGGDSDGDSMGHDSDDGGDAVGGDDDDGDIDDNGVGDSNDSGGDDNGDSCISFVWL